MDFINYLGVAPEHFTCHEKHVQHVATRFSRVAKIYWVVLTYCSRTAFSWGIMLR